MFGACYSLLWLCSDDSNWFSQQSIGKINIWPNMRLCSVPLVELRGSKTVLNACFLEVPAKTEVYRPLGFRNIFAAIAHQMYTNAFRLLNPVSEAIYHLNVQGGDTYK